MHGSPQALIPTVNSDSPPHLLLPALLIIAGAVAVWPLLRGVGVPLIVATTALPFVLLLTPRDAASHALRRLLVPYLPFLFFATAFVVLSVLGWMPDAWTTRRSAAHIPQQYLPYLLYAPIAFCFSMAFLYYGQRISARLLFCFTAALYVASTISFIIFTKTGTIRVDSSVSPWTVYNLVNADGFVLFALLWIIDSTSQSRAVKCMLAGLILVACVGSGQNQMAVLVYIGMVVTRTPLLVTCGVAVFLSAACIWVAGHPSDAYAIDANLGVRGVFWSDALRALNESGLAGVGFGNESIRNDFSIIGRDWQVVTADRLAFTGLHNSFLQALFRGGFLLFAALAFWIGHLVYTSATSSIEDRTLKLWCASTLIISLAVNPSLESMNFIFLNGILTGYIFCGRNITRARGDLRIKSSSPQATSYGRYSV